MPKIGSFALVLHSHIPYVLSHGTWPHGVDWLNEAVAETYIPILNVFRRLIEEGISPKVTVGLTPVLSEMLASDSFKEQFQSYLDYRIDSAEKDMAEFEKIGNKHLAQVARMWKEFYFLVRKDFIETYEENIIKAYADLQNAGHIEIITSGATHGYLPLLSRDVSIQAQIKQAVSTHKKHFGRKPKGIWLPECAYRPAYKWRPPVNIGGKREPYFRMGIEEFLVDNEIEYFFTDSHMLKGGKAIGVYLDKFDALKNLWVHFKDQYKALPEDTKKSPYKTYYVGGSEGHKRPVVFTRDPVTSSQVWSGHLGYPGDGNYLEFHKKKYPSGLNYWRVTESKADLADKEEYQPDSAFSKLSEHASHFTKLVKDTLKAHYDIYGEKGIIVSPYDAELFGHWWFEGPEWIYHTIKTLYHDGEVELVTGGEYLNKVKPCETVTLPEGSWGEGGYHWIWLNDTNQWTWKRIYEAEDEMVRIVNEFADIKDNDVLQDILKQAARELLLLQSSDWQFLISTFSAKDYAEMRLVRHYEDFKRLAELARHVGRGGALRKNDWNFLKLCKERDNIFSDIDPNWFKKIEFKQMAV
jgi:1,4-alpha-glucan branching enzyme